MMRRTPTGTKIGDDEGTGTFQAPSGAVMQRTLVLILMVAAVCGCQLTTPPADAPGVLEIRAVAGPVCPVERDPPEPGCEARPVAGARIVVAPGDGREIVVAEGVADDAGFARIILPAGAYLISGGEVQGFFGTPSPVAATVGGGETVSVELAWDTGIR